MYLDGKTNLPGDILGKVDRMSMAHSIEARSPLLDHRLIEFAQTIPASLKLGPHERAMGVEIHFEASRRGPDPGRDHSSPKAGLRRANQVLA